MNPEETNINPTPPVSEPPTPPAPPEPTVTPVAPAELTPTPEPVAPVVPDPVTPPAIPVVPPAPAPESPVRSLLAKALAKIQFRKQAKLEKIMVLARKQGQITNDQAQKLLRVSDATATRYLTALVKAGRLRRAGKPSHAIYQPIP